VKACAKIKNLRCSPQKMRLIADLIRGCHVQKALDILYYADKKSAAMMRKALISVLANAEMNHELDVDELFVVAVSVDIGGRLKRWRARAKGRGARILKPLSHINITVGKKGCQDNQEGKE
jgi:large subunit ribosomal protein L22